MPSKIVISKVNFSRWRLVAILEKSLKICPNEKLTSDLDSTCPKTSKMTYYMPSKIAISKVIFSRWRLAAILDKSLKVCPNEKLTSDLDSAYQKTP